MADVCLIGNKTFISMDHSVHVADEEVAALTSSTSYRSPPRPRSVSPFVYRPSFSARYGTLSAADRLEIELAVERARARARARAILSRSPSPIRRPYSPVCTVELLVCNTE